MNHVFLFWLKKKSGRNGFSTSLGQLLLQECNVLNSDPNLAGQAQAFSFSCSGICRSWGLADSDWTWCSQVWVQSFQDLGWRTRGSVGFAPPGQNLSGNRGCFCRPGFRLSSNCSIVYKVRDTAFNYHSPQSLKDFSGFSVFKGKFQYPSSVC